jgi:hypothetical protein
MTIIIAVPILLILDLEDRLNLVAGNMVNEIIDKSLIEMLLGYHPQLNQKEMALMILIHYSMQ